MLRLVTSDDMVILDDFVANPTTFNGSRLISISVIYHLLRSEKSNETRYSVPVLGLVGMIRDCAREVLRVLIEHGAGLGERVEGINLGDKWQQVSMCTI